MIPLISIKNLNFKYKAQKEFLFKDFNLKIDTDNRKISIVGQDGAGKSSLLKILIGLNKVKQGNVSLYGQKPNNSDDNFLSYCSYMSQELGLYQELSVLDNILLYAGLRGVNTHENKKDLLNLLKKVDLFRFKDYTSASLSGGMKQKLALTCAISSKPKILLLDEPTVGVDPLSRLELWKIIDDYLDETNSYCIFSTAYLEEAQKSDTTIILENGKLLESENPNTLINNIQNKTFTIIDNVNQYQEVTRELMHHIYPKDSNSLFIDVCPRMGNIDLLTKEEYKVEVIETYLHKLYDKLSLSKDFQIIKRTPLLEDCYLLKTFSKEEIKQSISVETNKNFDKNKTIIEVKKIKKVFGDFVAVHSSTFNVKKGEIFGLLGPNGAGKTTTFRMICALLNPSFGEVLVNGYNLAKAKSEVRSEIGYVSQKFSLYGKLTCKQNLEYFGQSYGLQSKELQDRINTLALEFSLKPYLNIFANEIPFGIQRQLSMACALLHKPKILFLDEATSGADPKARRNFWQIISKLSESGTSIIVTTHFMEEAEYCDRFLIQDRGKILVLGKPDDICIKDNKRVSVEQTFIDLVIKERGQNEH